MRIHDCCRWGLIDDMSRNWMLYVGGAFFTTYEATEVVKDLVPSQGEDSDNHVSVTKLSRG